MSNVKEVFIKGSLPFDLDNDADLQRLIGALHAPTFGLTMTWQEQRYLPNKHGGSTSMHTFAITGAEAVREEYLEHVVRTFSKHGPVTQCRFRDAELATGWFDCIKWAGDEWKKNFKEG